MSEFYIGLMSGTSVDAIDAVLMDFEKSNTRIISSYSQELNSQLHRDINSAIAAKKPPKKFEELDTQFANVSTDTVKNLLKQSSIDAKNVVAIGSHGQTIFHDPKGVPAISLQIGNSQIIANQTGIPTVGNFRQADIDAGGEGAPLACAYHAEVLQSITEERVILNLGGIANITKLPTNTEDPIIGFDVGPANTLMDAWAYKHLNKSYDQDGEWAKNGSVNKELLEKMLSDNYFSALPPKSTGREHFNLEWLQQHLSTLHHSIAPEDIQATLLSLTIQTIADSINAWCPLTKKNSSMWRGK